jgi:D-3-phosphoglycerate dehydrogenase
MHNIAIITTAFGNGLPDREHTYAALADELELRIRYCTKEELLADPKGIKGVIVGVEKADKQLFTCPDLRVAMKFGVGLDNFDMESAGKAHVQVVNMPGINSDAVAEMTITLMLCVSRMILPMGQRMSNGQFVQYCSHTVQHKKLGIIGMGTIGRKVAKMATALGMECLGYDVRTFDLEGVNMVDLPTLFEQSDVITIHIPLMSTTHHLIGKEAFSRMKHGVILINTSRGGVVDDEELYERLQNGHIMGAGLDVFENEEIRNRLVTHENVICTPHVAAYTHETLRFMENTALKKIKACLAGEKNHEVSKGGTV